MKEEERGLPEKTTSSGEGNKEKEAFP